jgi:hypothetical protein
MYIDGTSLYLATAGNLETIRLSNKMPAGSNLWKKIGNHVYTYAAASNGTGNALSRIDCSGDKEDYEFLPETNYQVETINYFSYNPSWYMPEIYGDTVLYSNAKTFGAGSSYKYVYAAKLSNVAKQNEEYKKVEDYIGEYSMNEDLQSLMRYYFRTGKTAAFDSVEKLYDSYQKEEFKKFRENTEFKKESDFVAFIGEMTKADAEEIETAWVNYLRKEAEEEETKEEGLATWAIVLIAVGSVIVVAGAITTVCIVVAKKKAAKKAAEATVNAYKRKKIDTTDDKSIDVYADEETEKAEEAAEEIVGETEITEETTEEVVETTEETAYEETEKTEEVVEETEITVEE